MITIEYIDGKASEINQEEIVVCNKGTPKGFAKPDVKEVFISQDGKDFGIIFKLASKLPAIWKRFFLTKEDGDIYDPEEALHAAYQSGGYIDDGSGSYVSCPLAGNIPESIDSLSAEEIERRLIAFITVVHACTQEKTIEKIFDALPKKKNGMLHKGRVIHIGYLHLVDNDGSTFEITAKNEDDSQALIEIRSNVPVVDDLLNQYYLFMVAPDNPLLTTEEYARIREEERKKREAERAVERQRIEAERKALQQAKLEAKEAERKAKLAEREAEKKAREEARLAAQEQRRKERAEWEKAKQLANLELMQKKDEAKRQRESEKLEAQQKAAEAREKKQEELQQARANATILYAPGNEPERIHARIQTLMTKLEEAYPDHVIFGLGKEHKKWGETITELYRQLGYADNRSFLEAYGFKMDEERGKGGRPVTLDANAIIEELKRRYPDGAGSMKLDELRAANPDLPIKTLQNNANESLGMSLVAYLKSISILQSSARVAKGNSSEAKNDEKHLNRQAYNSGNLYKTLEAEQRYLNIIAELNQRLPIVRMSDVAAYLGVAKASASVMLKKLQEKGLVVVEGRAIKVSSSTQHTIEDEI